MNKIKRFNDLNENNKNEEIIINDDVLYNEQEVYDMLVNLGTEIVYSFDDYGRGYDFASKIAEEEAIKTLKNFKK